MALTRKLLKGMGLTDEQVDTIIEAHVETVDSLKVSIDFCASLGVKHISSYLLKIEEGTRFYERREFSRQI